VENITNILKNFCQRIARAIAFLRIPGEVSLERRMDKRFAGGVPGEWRQ
jgi:hypothetical protein